MATQDFDASAAPLDLVTALGLTRGETYTVQNLSTVATMFFRSAAAAPAPGARGFRIEASGAVVVRVPTGTDGVFVWTDGAAAPGIIDDAA